MRVNSSIDTILLNGKIITMDIKNPIVEALVIKEDKIVATGKTIEIKKLLNKNINTVDLKGNTVIPGLIESHCHPASAGTELLHEIDLSQAQSIGEIIELIQEKTNDLPPGKWIKGMGYNEQNLKEKKHINRWDLDKATKNHPTFIQRIDYHLGVANSQALNLAKINKDSLNLKNGKIGRDEETLEPNGLLGEAAQGLVKDLIPPYSIEEIKKGLVYACQILAKWGITSFCDAAVEHDSFAAYQELFLEKKLPLRVGLIIEAFDALGFKGYFKELEKLGVKTNFGSDYLKIIGVKIFTDGSLSGGTAALYQPYQNDSKNYGVMNTEGDELINQIKSTYKAGLRPIIHAIGDKAIDQAIKGIELSLEETKNIDHRIRIEHCNLTTKESIEKIKKNKIIVSSSITHLYELGFSHLEALGKQRIKNYFMLNSFIQKGILVIGNSDWPITCGNPFLGINTAVNRRDMKGNLFSPEQSISVEEALRLYTINAAYATFDETKKGSLEPGKYADLVIIGSDIYDIPKEELKDIEVIGTMVGGNFVYKKNGNKIF